jgi:predicted HicB family RNase H-like nuclease
MEQQYTMIRLHHAPEDLVKALKIAAINAGVSLNDYVVKVLQNHIKGVK